MSFTTDWFSDNIPIWENIFKETKIPENILEIGSFQGRSTCWLLENTQAHVTCIDTWEGSPENSEDEKKDLFEIFKQNIEPWGDRVTVIRDRSDEALRKFKPEPIFDFVYVDGSHHAWDIIDDAVLSWKLLKPNGVMIFDDFEWCAPGREPEDPSNPRTAIQAFCHGFRPSKLWQWYQVAVQKPPTAP